MRKPSWDPRSHTLVPPPLSRLALPSPGQILGKMTDGLPPEDWSLVADSLSPVDHESHSPAVAGLFARCACCTVWQSMASPTLECLHVRWWHSGVCRGVKDRPSAHLVCGRYAGVASFRVLGYDEGGGIMASNRRGWPSSPMPITEEDTPCGVYEWA
jgi:hypothetical protein